MKLIGFRENSNKKTTKKQSIRSLRSKNMSLWKCFEWNYILNSLIHRQDMFYKIFDLRTFHVFCSFVECYREKNWKPSKNSFRNCKIVWKKYGPEFIFTSTGENISLTPSLIQLLQNHLDAIKTIFFHAPSMCCKSCDDLEILSDIRFFEILSDIRFSSQ